MALAIISKFFITKKALDDIQIIATKYIPQGTITSTLINKSTETKNLLKNLLFLKIFDKVILCLPSESGEISSYARTHYQSYCNVLNKAISVTTKMVAEYNSLREKLANFKKDTSNINLLKECTRIGDSVGKLKSEYSNITGCYGGKSSASKPNDLKLAQQAFANIDYSNSACRVGAVESPQPKRCKEIFDFLCKNYEKEFVKDREVNFDPLPVPPSLGAEGNQRVRHINALLETLSDCECNYGDD